MSIKFSNELSLWARRLAVYFSLGAAVIIASHIVFSYFGLLHTDVDSARALLSALVTSEAAILAIVVSLSLVAVQLAASSYSARVIEVFRRTPDLWILILVYGVTIFYGLGVLKLIERGNSQGNGLSNLEGHIALSYYLGVFAFVALVPYIWKTLDMLKPSTVINILAKSITKENILESIGKNFWEVDAEKNPIQPIIDIVRGSLMRYDYEAARDGLRAIGDSASCIFENNVFEVDEEIISINIFNYFTKVGILAASKENDDTAREVIRNLYKIGMVVAKRKLETATLYDLNSIRNIGIAAVARNLEGSTLRAVGDLGQIGDATIEQNLKTATLVALEALEKIKETATEQGLENTSKQATFNLEILWEKPIVQELISGLKKDI